jgi:hypothetical protein
MLAIVNGDHLVQLRIKAEMDASALVQAHACHAVGCMVPHSFYPASSQ